MYCASVTGHTPAWNLLPILPRATAGPEAEDDIVSVIRQQVAEVWTHGHRGHLAVLRLPFSISRVGTLVHLLYNFVYAPFKCFVGRTPPPPPFVSFSGHDAIFG